MLPTMLTTSTLSSQNKKPSQAKKVQKPSLKKGNLNEDAMTTEAKETFNRARQQMKSKLDSILPEDDDDDSDSDATADSDALTTMNAILEYNKKLMQKLVELENNQKKITNQHVQETVKDTYDEVKSKYDHTLPKNASFELPIGDLLTSYGNFTTEELPEEEEQKEVQEEEEEQHDEDDTVHDGEEAKNSSGSISIGNGDKDDIVVKVEATKTGITFCIHIPRN